ncbi:P-loop containing nucleoside triphosphate hydrolase protein, partial [Dimargaris cristalligena]
DGDTIEFRNVSFAYDVRTPVLKDLNFSIPVGRTTAIVGISGHGKSTILNLIMRMMDVSSGAILIGGVDIRRMAQRELRSQMALVNQFFTGFPGSIYFNIAYGAICQNKLVSRADVISAARSVGLCDKIMALPHGFDSPFDAQGGAMSGGELQRMGLARALVKQAPILLLDEATAALDSISETKIMEHIRRSGKTRTTVILAHRLSTIRDADQIIVLDHGRVAETGTHLELVARGGIYSKMWNMAQQAQASDSSVIAAPVGDIA